MGCARSLLPLIDDTWRACAAGAGQVLLEGAGAGIPLLQCLLFELNDETVKKCTCKLQLSLT